MKRILVLLSMIAGIIGVAASLMHIINIYSFAGQVNDAFGTNASPSDIADGTGANLWSSWIVLFIAAGVVVFGIISLISANRLFLFILGGALIAAVVFAVIGLIQNFSEAHEAYSNITKFKLTLSVGNKPIDVDTYVKVNFTSQIILIAFTVFGGIVGSATLLKVVKA